MLLPCFVACSLGGCSHLPIDGPLTSEILTPSHNGGEPHPHYVVVDLTTSIADQLAPKDIGSFKREFGDEAVTVENKIKPGDFVAATIWEVGAASPLLGTSGTASTIGTQNEAVPEQVVAPDGTIAIPFVGRSAVGYLTIPEAEKKISAELKGKASQPQVVLSITKNMSNMATILGDDIKGTSYVLNPGANRILDAIAAAGGIESPVYQAQVKLIRDGRSLTLPLQAVIADPGENVHIHPHDTLVVSKNPAFFTVLGALGHNAQIQFQNTHLNLEEALGNAGGLLDERADPQGVFIFRFEPRSTVTSICPGCDVGAGDAKVAVVYRLDMSKGDAFFIGQHFEISDHDVIYVSNSPRVQLGKVLALVRDLFSPVLTTAVVARSVQN
jgi:polysaccharide export outer membrane protein